MTTQLPDGPVFTRHDDDRIEIAWPSGRPEWFAVSPEAIEAFVGEHNRLVAESALLRDRLARVEVLEELWLDYRDSLRHRSHRGMDGREANTWDVAATQLRGALSAGTPTDSADETAGE